MSRDRAILPCALAVAALLAGCRPAPGPAASRLPWRVLARLRAPFHRPRGVTVARDGRVFTVDRRGMIRRFSPSGALEASWRMPEIEAGQPVALAADPEGGVVVSDTHYSRVIRFDRDGRALAIWGRPGTGPGAFTLVRGIAAGRDGRVYVGDAGARDRVQVFDLTGRFLFAWGRTGRGPGAFRRVQGIAVDDDADRVYVADAANHRIQVFDRRGRFLAAWGRMGTGPGAFRYPYGVAVVPGGGCIAVVEWGNRRIQLLDARGACAGIWTGGDLAGPWAVAFTADGRALIADADADRVLLVDVGGVGGGTALGPAAGAKRGEG